MKARSGFTLVESLAVMLILASVVYIGLQCAGSFRKSSLETSEKNEFFQLNSYVRDDILSYLVSNGGVNKSSIDAVIDADLPTTAQFVVNAAGYLTTVHQDAYGKGFRIYLVNQTGTVGLAIVSAGPNNKFEYTPVTSFSTTGIGDDSATVYVLNGDTVDVSYYGNAT